MPLKYVGKAKAHVFLDVAMDEAVKPVPDYEVRQGAGTKVVITLGPSCQEIPTLMRLLQAGVTCARIDLSWGTKQFHARSLANLGEAMMQTRRLCSVWLDTTGREVVVRRPMTSDPSGWPRIDSTKMNVEEGQEVVITTDPTVECSASLMPITYPGFPDLVEVGQVLQVGRYLATGTEGVSLYLEVLARDDTRVTCVATNSATLEGLLNVMVCHTEDEDFHGDFALPLLTEHDVDCIRDLGTQFEVDFVSLSFCNSADDLYTTRALLDSLGMEQTKIIAKIERKAAVRNFEAIAHVADGIIISRGNLGLDFEAEVMALLQKRIISRCNQLGKPVLLTRIVDTMVNSPRPTRAEATDVANAVLDGVDGLLLGAETLRGQHPVATVETVLKLSHAAEKYFDHRTHHETLMGDSYEEEVGSGSLHFSDVSVADFRMYGAGGHGISLQGEQSPDTTLYRRHRTRSFGAHMMARASSSDDGVHPGALHSGHAGFSPANGSGAPAIDTIHGSPATAAAAAVSPTANGPSPGLSSPTACRGIGGTPAAGAKLASVAIAAATPGAASRGFSAAHGGVDGAPLHPQAYLSSFGSLPPQLSGSSLQLQRILQAQAPYMSKLESLASSATRTAEKINAGLIVVMVQSGRTVSLVAKYRPPMPIMAVVVPQLKATSLGWHLEGKYLARQTLALRGVVPMMAAPMSSGESEDLLSEAVRSAYLQRLVGPQDYVVSVMSHRGSMTVKVVQVNRAGTGLRSMAGLNSSMIGGEAPDVIPDHSPFGAYMPPPSPRVGPQVGRSPSRTLSGRPSPALGILAPLAPPPPLNLAGGFLGGAGLAGHVAGGGVSPVLGGGGSGGGNFLISTASEAFGDYGDYAAGPQLASGVFGATWGGSPGSGASSPPGGVSSPSGAVDGLTGMSTPLRGTPSLEPASPGADSHGHLPPISEQPSVAGPGGVPEEGGAKGGDAKGKGNRGGKK